MTPLFPLTPLDWICSLLVLVAAILVIWAIIKTPVRRIRVSEFLKGGTTPTATPINTPNEKLVIVSKIPEYIFKKTIFDKSFNLLSDCKRYAIDNDYQTARTLLQSVKDEILEVEYVLNCDLPVIIKEFHENGCPKDGPSNSNLI